AASSSPTFNSLKRDSVSLARTVTRLVDAASRWPGGTVLGFETPNFDRAALRLAKATVPSGLDHSRGASVRVCLGQPGVFLLKFRALRILQVLEEIPKTPFVPPHHRFLQV